MTSEINDDAIRREFIRRVLLYGGRLMLGDMLQSIRKFNLIDSGFLSDHVRMAVDVSGTEYEGKLSFAFPLYGRFQDMGAGRTATDDMIETLHFLGKPKVSHKRKPRKWYTRNVYGNLNTIINGLIHGYTEQMIAGIKHTLETRNKS